MSIGRREFLAGAGALAVSARSVFAAAQATRPGAIFPASVRADFPSVALETYMNSAAMHPLGTFAARGVEQAHGLPAPRRRPRPRRLRRRQAAGPEEALRPADWRHRQRDRLHRQHLRRREHRRHGDGPAAARRQHRDRRAALHDVALHVQGAREERRRAPHRQAPQLGDRRQRHGPRDRQEHAAGLAGARVERQRLHARRQGGQRARARARRVSVRRHHPGGRRRADRREARSASTSPRPAPTSG